MKFGCLEWRKRGLGFDQRRNGAFLDGAVQEILLPEAAGSASRDLREGLWYASSCILFNYGLNYPEWGFFQASKWIGIELLIDGCHCEDVVHVLLIFQAVYVWVGNEEVSFGYNVMHMY